MPKVDHSKCEHEHDGAKYNSCGSCGKPLWVPALGEGIGGFSRGVTQSLKIPITKGYTGSDYSDKLGFDENKQYTTYSISMLRQWLNEDRITEPSKMVTNEMIEKWLKLEPLVDCIPN